MGKVLESVYVTPDLTIFNVLLPETSNVFVCSLEPILLVSEQSSLPHFWADTEEYVAL
jgi:hypothetical protein